MTAYLKIDHVDKTFTRGSTRDRSAAATSR